MQRAISEWVQRGHLWVWRYRDPGRNCRGWHFSADPAGCRSVIELLQLMNGATASHRTLKLAPVTDDVLGVPNFPRKPLGHFRTLRIEFQPGAEELALSPDDDRLVLIVGNARLQELLGGFVEVEVGLGDIAIAPSDKRRADPWMFWWPPKRYWKTT